MNRYNLISFMALLILVVTLPLYALQESQRMDQAQTETRQQLLANATDIYLETCVGCHGMAGEGLNAMPALNNPVLAEASNEALYKIIARASHRSAMAAWHIDEGGILSDYQINGLITFIRYSDWAQVAQLAETRQIEISTAPDVSLETVSLTNETNPEANPHECRACHEEPKIHVGQFGQNCARCHTLAAWTPARLTRHDFPLDHGAAGSLTCQTCHTETYIAYTCYQCHDHQPEQMHQIHTETDIPDFENCIDCHPTGQQGEAETLTAAYRGIEW